MSKSDKTDKPSIIIDFDSTISSTELLPEMFSVALEGSDNADEIRQKIEDITNQGMEGKLPFDESLKRRIDLLPLTKGLLELMVLHTSTLISESFKKNVDELNSNYDLHIVSGGFADVIVPVMAEYGIFPHQIHANKFVFDGDEFKGIDTSSPLVREKGKVELVKSLGLGEDVAVIGDGYTDYQIKEANLAKYFIAYAEHVYRDYVVSKADFVANTFDEVVAILRKIF